MQIKMRVAKNVYGKRVKSGAVLTVGKTIPEWQAERFVALGLASKYTPPAKSKKAAKA